MNFQLQNFQLYNKSLKDWSVGRQLILFPENINVTRGTLRFSGNRINCLPTDQSLSVYYWATCGHVFFKLNITQQARCSPGIKKSYMKKCLLTSYWSALDKNSRQWSYKPTPPTVLAAGDPVLRNVPSARRNGCFRRLHQQPTLPHTNYSVSAYNENIHTHRTKQDTA